MTVMHEDVEKVNERHNNLNDAMFQHVAKLREDLAKTNARIDNLYERLSAVYGHLSKSQEHIGWLLDKITKLRDEVHASK